MKNLIPKEDRPILIFIAALVVFIWSIIFLNGSVLELSNRKITYNNESFTPPTYLQYFSNEVEGLQFTVKGVVHVNGTSSKIVHIVPDDCLLSISVDGDPVNLDPIRVTGNTCDHIEGVTINLSDYLTEGRHVLELTGKNEQSGYSMQFLPSWRSPKYAAANLIMFTSLLVMFFLAIRSSIQTKGFRIILMVTISLGLVYFGYTNWFERVHDLHGHSDHITLISETKSLPASELCWECHQQRPYYLVGASIMLLTSSFNELNYQTFYSLLQILNLITMVVFFIFTTRTFELILGSLKKYKPSSIVSSALLAIVLFWPSGIIHSIRIGNDQLLYASFSIFIYYATRYWLNLDSSLIKVIMAAIFAYSVKIVGFVTLPVIPALFILKHQGLPKIRRLPNREVVLLVMSMAALLLIGIPFLTGQAQITPNKPQESFMVGNNIENYICFQGEIYFGRPDINTFVDEGGRQCFSNIFLKTMLFGEFHISENLHRIIALTLGSGLLVLLLAAGFHLAYKLSKAAGRQQLAKFIPIIIAAATLFGALIYFRIKNPYGSNMDFRYVYPIVSLLFVALLPIDKNDRAYKKILLLGSFIWITISIAFILAPLFTGVY